MTSRRLALLLALVLARPAAAEPHKLLVLQSEGRVKPATRAKIDAAIVKLARSAEPQSSAGELTYSDAATAVGCKADAPSCKDEVLSMLAVDEIVITTVTPKPGGTEITVRRVTRAGVSREMTMLLPAGAPPSKLDGIAPLFGAAPARSSASAPSTTAAPFGPPAPPAASPPPPAPAASASSPAPSAVTTSGHATGESPGIPPPSAVHEEPPPSLIVAPASGRASLSPASSSSSRRRHLEVAGMFGGGGMALVGVLFWGAATSVQGDIDKAPATTQQNLIDLKNLESRGDTYATLGNVLAISGLVVAGISTYFYVKDRRATSTTSARLMPAVIDHGAGLVFTMGGTP